MVCVRYTNETGPANFVFYSVSLFVFAKKLPACLVVRKKGSSIKDMGNN